MYHYITLIANDVYYIHFYREGGENKSLSKNALKKLAATQEKERRKQETQARIVTEDLLD